MTQRRRLTGPLLLIPLLVSASAFAQQQKQEGIAPAWDVSEQIKELAVSVRKVEPLLRHVNPTEWIEKGAPDAYVRQLQSTRQAITGLAAVSDQLARDPEKLTLALDVYYQMERMEMLMASLREGIRKYQSAELDQLIQEDSAANSIHRERLRQHIRDLASLREQEFQIVNEEAQRCRGILTKQPAPGSATPAKPATPAEPKASTMPASAPSTATAQSTPIRQLTPTAATSRKSLRRK